MTPTPRALVAAGLIGIGLAAGLVFGTGRQQPAADVKTNPDQEAVHKALEAFVTAFNAGDAKACAAAFSATAEYIDDESNRVEGPAAIETLLAKFFTVNKGAKILVTPDGVRTVSAGVAVEDGESVITVPDKATQSARRYAMVYAKVDGAWKIASIREYPEAEEFISPSERLKDLEWMVGDWIDEGPDANVSITCKWSADKSHFLREFAVQQKGKDLLKGTQLISVDPLTGSIKGWSLDSDGGHGESTWTQNGDSWLIYGNAITGDGDTAFATYVLKPVGKDRIELKVMNKVVADVVEPDVSAVLVRKLVK